jgi:hypothetical protein
MWTRARDTRTAQRGHEGLTIDRPSIARVEVGEGSISDAANESARVTSGR